MPQYAIMQSYYNIKKQVSEYFWTMKYHAKYKFCIIIWRLIDEVDVNIVVQLSLFLIELLKPEWGTYVRCN